MLTVREQTRTKMQSLLCSKGVQLIIEITNKTGSDLARLQQVTPVRKSQTGFEKENLSEHKLDHKKSPSSLSVKPSHRRPNSLKSHADMVLFSYLHPSAIWPLQWKSNHLLDRGGHGEAYIFTAAGLANRHSPIVRGQLKTQCKHTQPSTPPTPSVVMEGAWKGQQALWQSLSCGNGR